MAHHRVLGTGRAIGIHRKVELGHIQRLGDPVERIERRVVDVALDQAQKAGAEPCAGGQLLETQAEFLAPLAHTLAQGIQHLAIGAAWLAWGGAIGGHRVSVHPAQGPVNHFLSMT